MTAEGLDRARQAAEAWMLGHRPLAALGLTLLAYAAAHAVSQRGGRHPLLNPTLGAIVLVAAALLLLRCDYGAYFEDARLVHLLLGPAVVALAVPLYRHLPALRARAAALLAGSAAAILSVLALASALGASQAVLASIAPKSATVAVSMGIAEQSGGLPALTAVVTVLTGIAGALLAGPVLDLLRVRDPFARGFSMGVASHGIATARAFQESEAAGTAAGLAMGLNAVLTAFLVPPLLRWWL